MAEQLASEAAAWQAIQQAAAASKAFIAKWHSECERLGYDPDSAMGKAVAISLEESDKINDKIARQQRANKPTTNEPPSPAGTEGGESLNNLPDDAMMNHRDLAAALKLEAEPLRKRLDRWRSKNGDGWQELTEATAKEPRYLYHVAAVRAVLREAIKAK